MIDKLSVSIGKIVGILSIIAGYAYQQVSDAVGGILDKGFDAALSIGILMCGIVILALYFHQEKKHNRELISKISEDKDELFNAIITKQDTLNNELKQLSEKQIRALNGQSVTNKEIHKALTTLTKYIKPNENNRRT